MSRIRIFTAVGLIVIGVALAPWGRAAQPATPPKAAASAETDRERELKQLLADQAEEIHKLKLENAQLKRDIRELNSRQPAVLPELPPLKLAPPAAAPAVPKNAVPREFNGETYYLVPLNGDLDLKTRAQSSGTLQLRGENQTSISASNLPVTKTGR